VPLIALALKTVAGGSLVVGFSALSDALKPKAFAGLFAAAPSVALASLFVTVATNGSTRAALNAHSMIAGSAGMVVYCIAAAGLVRRLGAAAGSVLAWGAWAIVSFGAYWLLAT
jgi:hypothetical protein